MVMLFCERKNKCEKEIIEILKKYGGNFISDNTIHSQDGGFTIVSEYKTADIKLNKGIAVFCNTTERFKKQTFPNGIIGICEEKNFSALKILKENKMPSIICGMNQKNTITLSSINNDFYITALQRTITDTIGNEIEPCEFKIKLNKEYSPLAVMFSTAILLLKGILPKEF